MYWRQSDNEIYFAKKIRDATITVETLLWVKAAECRVNQGGIITVDTDCFIKLGGTLLSQGDAGKIRGTFDCQDSEFDNGLIRNFGLSGTLTAQAGAIVSIATAGSTILVNAAGLIWISTTGKLKLGATQKTGAEAELLINGGNADDLHAHGYVIPASGCGSARKLLIDYDFTDKIVLIKADVYYDGTYSGGTTKMLHGEHLLKGTAASHFGIELSDLTGEIWKNIYFNATEPSGSENVVYICKTDGKLYYRNISAIDGNCILLIRYRIIN
jgi:hypothetical protein